MGRVCSSKGRNRCEDDTEKCAENNDSGSQVRTVHGSEGNEDVRREQGWEIMSCEISWVILRKFYGYISLHEIKFIWNNIVQSAKMNILKVRKPGGEKLYKWLSRMQSERMRDSESEKASRKGYLRPLILFKHHSRKILNLETVEVSFFRQVLTFIYIPVIRWSITNYMEESYSWMLLTSITPLRWSQDFSYKMIPFWFIDHLLSPPFGHDLWKTDVYIGQITPFTPIRQADRAWESERARVTVDTEVRARANGAGNNHWW